MEVTIPFLRRWIVTSLYFYQFCNRFCSNCIRKYRLPRHLAVAVLCTKINSKFFLVNFSIKKFFTKPKKAVIILTILYFSFYLIGYDMNPIQSRQKLDTSTRFRAFSSKSSTYLQSCSYAIGDKYVNTLLDIPKSWQIFMILTLLCIGRFRKDLKI